MSELLALGVSHRTAPVAVRERLALPERALGELLTELRGTGAVAEAAGISTCNRTELYLVADDPVAAETELLGRLGSRARLRPTELAGIAYAPRNCDAARQLFRVTSGLESMVLGEYEIQGQVKRAQELAHAAGTTGPLLERLFDAALRTGKRVRTETGIGANRLSVASVAVDLAARDVGELTGRSVVVVGAGETAELVAQSLAARGVRTLFVANRRAARAQALASRFGGRVGSLEALPEALADADIVVTSTASPHQIVGADELSEVMRRRPDRPLAIIDIAVPRDVEAACADVPGVALHDIDDLQAVVATNLAGRRRESGAADRVVEEEIGSFARYLGQLDATPTIREIRAHAERVVAGLVAENAGRWESASEKDLARVEAIARAVAGRVLHDPTLRLKALGEEGAHGRIELARELFALDRHRGEHAPAAPRPAAPAPARDVPDHAPGTSPAELVRARAAGCPVGGGSPQDALERLRERARRDAGRAALEDARDAAVREQEQAGAATVHRLPPRAARGS